MKRFTILTLIAGVVATSSLLGMDIDFLDLWNDAIDLLPGKTRDALVKRAGKFSDQNKKLNALKDAVMTTVDCDQKQTILQRIAALQKPIKVVPTPSTPIKPEATLSKTAGVPAQPEVDPALTCRPPTKTAENPVSPTLVPTDHGVVTITDAPDKEEPLSDIKKTTKAEPNTTPGGTKLSAVGILRSPIFIGVAGLSTLAVIMYAYLKKVHTKKADDNDAQRDKNIMEEIYLA